MTKQRRYSVPSSVRRLSLLLLTLALLFPPRTVFADPLLLVRIAGGMDQTKLPGINDENPSAIAKMDEKGDIVFNCLNLSLPLAHSPFKNAPGIRKVMKHVRLQIDPNGIGAVMKLAFLF